MPTIAIPSPECTFEVAYGGGKLSVTLDMLDAYREIGRCIDATKDGRDFEYAQKFQEWVKAATGTEVPLSVADALFDAVQTEFLRQKKGRIDLLNSALPTPASTSPASTE